MLTEDQARLFARLAHRRPRKVARTERNLVARLQPLRYEAQQDLMQELLGRMRGARRGKG
jgi:hypothetical protein